MTMQTLYRLSCNGDNDECEAAGPAALTKEAARIRAEANGWDTGPHYTTTRQGRLTHWTDYCPAHKGAERS